MRTPTQNKSVSPGAPCPQCGRKAGACRPVPMGHWCQQEGLLEDTTLLIYPTPDPVHAAVGQDVQVMAARVEMETAQAEFDKVQDAWLLALGALSTAKVSKTGVFTSGGEYRPPSDSDVRRVERLTEAERQASKDREQSGELLVEARVRHQQAQTAARRRLTGSAPTI